MLTEAMHRLVPAVGAFVCGAAVIAAACSRNESKATSTFYDRKIGPILLQSCATSPSKSGCHVAADDRGNALGNLNVESYDALNLRRDLFVDYGPYGLPNLLLKVVPPFQLRLTTWDTPEPILVTTDIPHAGGSVIDVTSTSFTTLERWIENGAAENNAPVAPKEVDLEPCATQLGTDTLFDPAVDPAAADYSQFVNQVNPVLVENCAAGNCHGTQANPLYITCGQTDEQKRWNYFAAGDYISVEVNTSEILRRTLAPAQGGTFHEGGAIFQTPSEAGYQAMLQWAEAKGGPSNVPTEAGFDFFAKRVQPMLAKKGCMILGCHSAAMFHDYRIRGGSGGHFGLPATRKNYDLSLEQLALESEDPNASRLIRKNLAPPPAGGGVLHRGGPLLASLRGDPTQCDLAPGGAADAGPIDEQDPYCVIVRWIDIEREERMGGSQPMSGILYVSRPPKSGKNVPQDYAAYEGGADLLLAPATIAPDGTVSLGGSGTSLLGGCGLSAATADIGKPAVSWDGRTIAFAARSAANEPWRIYISDTAGCAVDPVIDAAPVDDEGRPVPDNGELVHNFDPAFAPDGRIVFASTRGNIKNVGAFAYSGPQRSPADPSKLNSNMYVKENGSIRQLTFLLNQEFGPAFMRDGRVIFTTEKRAPGFYQLAGRRQNLDGGDYHPLFGQRSTIGHNQFTDVIELADKNLAAIFSERGAAHGGGALAIINRSIGVDQLSDDPADYTQDPEAISWPNPIFYQRSIRIIDGSATGKLSGTSGAYRSPSPLPNGNLLASYAAGATDLANFDGNYDIVVVDSVTGARTDLISDTNALLHPVAIYAKQNIGVFESRPDEPNGHTVIYNDERRNRSEITFVDVPMIASLLFQNTRSGRFIPNVSSVTIWESMPPEPGVTDFAGGGGFVTSDQFGELYVRRRRLGSAKLAGDGSVKVAIPGGVPIVLEMPIQLAGDDGEANHHQREEMQFYPGEFGRQSFKRDLFNGLCGGCHGSVNGLESHVVVNPDILTQASIIEAANGPAADLLAATPGAPQGPPFP